MKDLCLYFYNLLKLFTMKTNKISTIAFGILISSCFILSWTACNNAKTEDTKEVAQDHNEAKFDDNANKSDDSKFLVAAAEINLEEVQLAKLAQTNANSDEVKKLGKMMEQDHSAAMTELNGLASKKQITIPTSITDNGQSAYKTLSEKKGKDFDKAYGDMIVDGHKDAISIFEKASTDCKDADIKSWAAGMLPKLRSHMDKAMTCQKNMEKM